MNKNPNSPSRTVESRSISQINDMLAEMTQSGSFTGSILIAQKGNVLLKKGFGYADRAQRIPNTPQTRFRLASISKQFTAMAVLILNAQGKLRIQNPLNNYLPDCPPTWHGITIHHLLTHTSGLSSQIWPLLMAIVDHKEPLYRPDQLIALFASFSPDFQPGEQFAYSNPGYILLARVIEQVSGHTYADFLKQAIFTPLKMHNSGYEDGTNRLANGYLDGNAKFGEALTSLPFPNGAGQLYSSVEDLFLWDQSLYTGQLLPRDELAQMYQPHVQESNYPGFSYGYGWFVGIHQDQPIVAHAGDGDGFTSLIIRYLTDRLTGIFLINQQDIEPIPIWTTIYSNFL